MHDVTPASRSRGRPRARPDDLTRQLILDAAADEFFERGYALTSMDVVAKRSGVSKKTLYRLIPTKADLFRDVIVVRIDRFMLAVDAETLDQLEVAVALERLMTQYGTLTLSRDTIAINRVVLSECDRFPELASTFYTEAIVATTAVLEHYLERQMALGCLRAGDAHTAAGMLRGMMIMEPQRAVMMGRGRIPSPSDIAERARACVAMFLDGCRRPPG